MKEIPVWIRVVIVLLGGTILACILFPFIRDTLPLLALDFPPGRVFRRIWMISVVLGLILFAKWLRMRPPSQVGYRVVPYWWKNLLIGTAVAWGYLVILACIYFQAGIWYWLDDFNTLESLLEGFIRGLLVSGIEEYIFRGMIFLSFKQRFGWIRAAVFCSLIFSSLHFIEGRAEMNVSLDQWWSGFAICGTMLVQMASRITLFPDALSLFLVGMILCYAMQKSGTLWYGAGLHGGWVWAAAVFADMAERNREWDAFWVSSSRLFDGVIPMLGMLIIFPVTVLLMRSNWLVFDETQTRSGN